MIKGFRLLISAAFLHLLDLSLLLLLAQLLLSDPLFFLSFPLLVLFSDLSRLLQFRLGPLPFLYPRFPPPQQRFLSGFQHTPLDNACTLLEQVVHAMQCVVKVEIKIFAQEVALERSLVTD